MRRISAPFRISASGIAAAGPCSGGLDLCEKAGLIKLGHMALDGTKIKANASKHKVMSY
jgi:hypothetical protein